MLASEDIDCRGVRVAVLGRTAVGWRCRIEAAGLDHMEAAVAVEDTDRLVEDIDRLAAAVAILPAAEADTDPAEEEDSGLAEEGDIDLAAVVDSGPAEEEDNGPAEEGDIGLAVEGIGLVEAGDIGPEEVVEEDLETSVTVEADEMIVRTWTYSYNHLRSLGKTC